MTYLDRNLLLASMGFCSYEAYLASDLWKGIKARVKKDSCCLCGLANPRYVHHVQYDKETMLGITLEHLVAVCRRCHRDVEFMVHSSNKRTLEDSQRRFFKLLAKRERKLARRRRKQKRKALRKAPQTETAVRL